jgi:hypothetical protein
VKEASKIGRRGPEGSSTEVITVTVVGGAEIIEISLYME